MISLNRLSTMIAEAILSYPGWDVNSDSDRRISVNVIRAHSVITNRPPAASSDAANNNNKERGDPEYRVQYPADNPVDHCGLPSEVRQLYLSIVADARSFPKYFTVMVALCQIRSFTTSITRPLSSVSR